MLIESFTLMENVSCLKSMGPVLIVEPKPPTHFVQLLRRATAASDVRAAPPFELVKLSDNRIGSDGAIAVVASFICTIPTVGEALQRAAGRCCPLGSYGGYPNLGTRIGVHKFGRPTLCTQFVV